VLAVLAVAAVAGGFFAGLGRAPLFDLDEGAFSQATMEMFQRGDFLSPHLDGAPRHDKPILIYWAQAACVRLLGPTELAFRLPSALSATLWVGLVFLFVRRHGSRVQAHLAAIMLATTPGVIVIARAATADALLNLCVTATMLAAWQRLVGGARPWLITAHAAAGVGMLTKGPVAVLIPAVTTLVFCLARRDFRTWRRAAFDPAGLAVFGTIAVPWYALILRREGWAFVEGFFVRHHLARLGGPLEGHGGSLVYYIPVLLLIVMPFTGLLWPVARRWREIWRNDLEAYLLLWFGVVFAVFSLSGTKLPHYLLYGLTGLVVLMARHSDDTSSRAMVVAPAMAWAGAWMVLPRLVDSVAPLVKDTYFRDLVADAGPLFGPLGLAFGVTAFLFVVVLAIIPRVRAVTVLLTAAGTGVVSMLAVVLPVVSALAQQPVKDAARLCRARGITPVVWRMRTPSVSVYRGAPTPPRTPGPGDVVLTRTTKVAGLPGTPGEVLFERHGIVLVRLGR
jgi:4-amino-4-deoxy-L-arabinose transferase-like glycosyltransferase